jgi:hypothetical protein
MLMALAVVPAQAKERTSGGHQRENHGKIERVTAALAEQYPELAPALAAEIKFLLLVALLLLCVEQRSVVRGQVLALLYQPVDFRIRQPDRHTDTRQNLASCCPSSIPEYSRWKPGANVGNRHVV